MENCKHNWTESDKCPLCLIETTGNKSASVTGYVAVCERCKFIKYEDRDVYCGQGHWYGDDDPENLPDSPENDLWSNCEDFAT